MQSSAVQHSQRGLWLMVLVVALTGCLGSSEPFDYVEVTGKVTYEDGSIIPADNITVTFVPQLESVDETIYPPSGMADVNVADGTFDTVTSRNYGDGIVPGKHKVLVQAFIGEMEPSTAIPAIYADPATTPLEIDTSDTKPLKLLIARP